MAHPADPPRPPAVPFGRYVLKERLAQGGMGEVFRAVAIGESGFEKPVVIKRILPEHASRADFAELFVAEAKLMTRLAHPNIVGVLDFGRGERGDYFLVLELVSGVDLGRLLRAHSDRGAAFPVPLALYLVTQVLRGLHYAHARPEREGGGLVHRDISPGNVLLSTEGEVKIADFGVALVGDGEPTGEESARGGRRAMVGKPAYMAPEQYQRAPVDRRADVFSTGVVLYQLLTGRLPFEGDGEGAKQDAARRGDFGRARDLRAEVSPALDAILRRALAPAPGDRFPDARSMAHAIEALRDQGERLASGDDLADAVRSAMETLPSRARPVISLSASPSAIEEQELTRSGDPGGVGSFTVRVTDVATATERDTPPVARAPEGFASEVPTIAEPATTRLAEPIVASATVRGDAPIVASATVRGEAPIVASATVRGDAPSALPPLATEGDSVVVPLDRPLGGALRWLALGALLLVAGGAVRLLVPRSDALDLRALPGASSLPSSPVSLGSAPALPTSAPSPLAAPSGTLAPAPASPTTRPLVAPTGALPASPTSPTSLASAAPPAEDCSGGVRIASTGSWMVSGGPQLVQSPGVYTWRCGTFSLRAVSRADATQIKQVSVTVRPSVTALVDLR